MKVYQYKADEYCQRCGKSICDRLKAEGKAPADPSDEYSYDSGEYPKGPFSTDAVDSVRHCGAGADCLDAIELPDGDKIGALLEHSLTADGVENLKEQIRRHPDSPIVKLQVEHYGTMYDLRTGDEDSDDMGIV